MSPSPQILRTMEPRFTKSVTIFYSSKPAEPGSTGNPPLILLLNGAFGVGKTTVARAVVSRIPGALLFDPEIAGIGLQRLTRLVGRSKDDFQDFAAWRKLTITGLRVARYQWTSIIVPMAISNTSYLDELRDGIGQFEPRVLHYCLVAPKEIVHSRLKLRGSNPVQHSWQFRRASECCDAHTSAAFAEHVDATNRTPDEIASALVTVISSGER